MSSEGPAPAPGPSAGPVPAPAPEARVPAVLTTKTLTYRTLNGLAKLGSRTLFPTRYEGREHLPAAGPLVLCSNHQSYLDIPLIAAGVPRHVSFVARESLARSPLLARFMERCGAVLVRRGEADHGALKEMVAHLAAGDCVCIFPEGSRTKDGSIGEFRRGALLAARRGRAPVVPVAVTGSFEAWPPGQGLPRPHRIRIRFGEPVDPRDRDALEKVRGRVAELAEGE